MKKFIYLDHSNNPSKIVFECEAESILVADSKFKDATGKDAAKIPSIGCQVHQLTK